MIFAYVILGFVTLVATFVAGAQYGRAIEQAINSELVKLKAAGAQEVRVLTDAEVKALDAFKKL
jgi:hypothetical protein